MSNHGGKGSKQSPTKVSDKEFQDNWEKIFGKKEPKVKFTQGDT